MEPELLYFSNQQREEWHLPNAQDPITGEVKVVRHNDTGPAVITAKGFKAWYSYGVYHRVGDPAIEFDDFKVWYQHDKLHRTDGPAVEFSDGTKQYWVNGVRTG